MRISDWSSDVCSSDLVIETKQTSDGFIIGGTDPEFTNPFGGFTPSRAKRSYTDILPSANLSVDLSDQVVLRFAAGKTVTRPDFVDITPGVDLNGTLLTGRGGDPNLDPYRANPRSDEHTSELQSLMRNSYAVFCLKK